MRELVISIGTLALTILHLTWYVNGIAWRLWELSGGIRQEGRWTHVGASDWAWTVPVHVPAGLCFAADAAGLGLGLLGLVFLLAGSLAAGFSATVLAVGLCGRRRPRFHSWHLGLCLAGWLWIPVPASMSWIYQWTVIY